VVGAAAGAAVGCGAAGAVVGAGVAAGPHAAISKAQADNTYRERLIESLPNEFEGDRSRLGGRR
jgi:hypothetical protein